MLVLGPRTWPCSPRSRSRRSRRRARPRACSPRRRRSSRRSGRRRSPPAPAALPRRARPRRTRARPWRGSTARSRPAVRAPIAMPAGTSIRSSSSSATPSPRSSPITPAPRLRAGHQADVRQARLEAAAQRVAARRARAPRRRARGRRGRGSSSSSSTATVVEPELRADPHDRARDRRVAHDEHARRGQAGSRKTSIAPPDRHGFWTVTAPSSLATSTPSGPTSPRRRTAGSAAARPRRSPAPAASRRARCARRTTPPTKPSIVPSPSTSATLPGLDARRALRAHHGRGHERLARRRRAPALAATWRRGIIAAARVAPASPPRRAPGCRACRCARPRASRAARRSRR